MTETFPYSSVPLHAAPDSTWATCGTCGRSFPDLYPSARCPFEDEDDGWDEDDEPKSTHYCASCNKDIEDCHCPTTLDWRERPAGVTL